MILYKTMDQYLSTGHVFTRVLLNRIYPTFANSVDPDQLNWSGYALFAIKYVNL